MKAYHFIKYNENTSLNNLIAHTSCNTTLCFDFEDSIQDCLSPQNTPFLKSCYRGYFQTIIRNCSLDIAKIKIGIRINQIDSPEYLSDIESLSSIKHLAVIFLPKLTSAEQITILEQTLKANGISYEEIIPVIETKEGMDSLEHILTNKSDKIRRVAFGHCDYNYSNHIYPFFHQNAREYWSWITRISEIVMQYNTGFVNSPFLQLDNDIDFTKMISLLETICGSNVAQITLTKHQTRICNTFSFQQTKFTPPELPNTLDLRVPHSYAEDFIVSFESNYVEKGFAINRERILLSPQEYKASLRFKNKFDYPDINFTFTGGCFPVQANLPFEKLFHQLLKREVENKIEVNFNINIIRYERFQNCLNKITTYNETKPINILVFSIRPEPFLRRVKFYFKYKDQFSEKRKWSLNIPILKKTAVSKFDLTPSDNRFNPIRVKDISKFHKTLINLNYLAGLLFDNDTKALQQYLELIIRVIGFCKSNDVYLILMGPPVRTNTFMERGLSVKLDEFMRKSLGHQQVDFINGSDLVKDRVPLFSENGIYANEHYHKLIADRLTSRVLPIVKSLLLHASIGKKI